MDPREIIQELIDATAEPQGGELALINDRIRKAHETAKAYLLTNPEGTQQAVGPGGPEMFEYQDLWFQPGTDWKQAVALKGLEGWCVTHIFQFTQVQNQNVLVGAAPHQTVNFVVAGVLLCRPVGPWSVQDVVQMVSQQPTANEELEAANAVLAGLSFPDPDQA